MNIYEAVVPGLGSTGSMGEDSIIFGSMEECGTFLEENNASEEAPDAYCRQFMYEKLEHEVCAIFSNGTVCVEPNNYENID